MVYAQTAITTLVVIFALGWTLRPAESVSIPSCSQDGKRYDLGQKWVGAVGDCFEYKCIENGSIDRYGCATPMFSDARCRMNPGNASAPYPDCCEIPYCPPEVYNSG